jgi:hypothetical protein
VLDTLIGEKPSGKDKGTGYERKSMDHDFSGIAVCLRFMALRGGRGKT